MPVAVRVATGDTDERVVQANPPDHQRDGGKVPRHRDWHGATHLRRASDESARGGAMSKGSAPSLRSVPAKIICDALDPP